MSPSIVQIKDKVFYGWVVVVSIVASTFIMMGINSSFGVFFKSFEDTFNLTRATTSTILSGRMAFSSIFAFLGGWGIDRYGPRIVFSIMGFFIGLSLILTSQTTSAWQLYITYSLLLAVGIGASYVVMTSTVLRWFDRKRGLALGIAGSGSGLGIAFIAPLSAYLIDSFDWRSALLILGGIAWLVMLPASQFLKKNPSDIGALPDGSTHGYQTTEIKHSTASTSKTPLLQIFRTRSFWSFLFIWLFMAFNMSFLTTHIVPYAIDLGFSTIESATILSLLGITMIVGRLTAGIIADKLSAKIVAIICSLLQIGALLWVVWIKDLWMLYIFGFIYGLAQGGFGTSTTVLIGRTYSLDNIGKILGVLEIGIFIGAAIGPYIGGVIFDASSSYTLAFLIMAGIGLARTLVMAQITRDNKRH